MTATRPATDLSELLCFDLYAASRAMTALYRPLLSPLGLTYPQYLVLVVLWKVRATPVKALTEALRLDYGTLSPLLQRLERDGLITRERRGADERSVTIGLTPAGAALQFRARGIPDAICAALDLNVHQIRGLQTALRQITVKALTEGQQ